MAGSALRTLGATIVAMSLLGGGVAVAADIPEPGDESQGDVSQSQPESELLGALLDDEVQ